MTTGMKHLAAYQANLLDYNAAKARACNYIGNQIRAARKSMKLSLEQLSQILMGYGVDIGRVAVNKWERVYRFQVRISFWPSVLRCIWRMALIIL